MIECADQVFPKHRADTTDIQGTGCKVIPIDEMTVCTDRKRRKFAVQFRRGAVDNGVFPTVHFHQCIHVIAVIVMPVSDKIQIHMIDADSFQVIEKRIIMYMLRDRKGTVCSAVNEDGIISDGQEIGIPAADLNLVQAQERAVRGRRRNGSRR